MFNLSDVNQRTIWIVSIVTGLTIALASAGESYLTGIMIGGSNSSFLASLKWTFVFWGSWVVLAPFVVTISSRNLLDADHWKPSLFRIAAGALLFWGAHTLMEAGGMRIIPEFRDLHGGTFAGAFQAHFRRSWHVNLLVYSGIVALTQWITTYMRFREQETQSARLKAAVAEAQINALKMQLHPHFLFNALHSISTLMHRDVPAADRMLIKLSDVLRNTIDSSRTETTTLSEEFNYIEKYLAVEKVRFGGRLVTDIDLPERLRTARVPDLLLQPLIENAIRHGFEPRSGQFHLWVRANASDGVLELEVADDGAGLDEPGDICPGLGLTITRERLDLMYGGEADLDVSAREDGGVIARIRLPYESAMQPSHPKPS